MFINFYFKLTIRIHVRTNNTQQFVLQQPKYSNSFNNYDRFHWYFFKLIRSLTQNLFQTSLPEYFGDFSVNWSTSRMTSDKWIWLSKNETVTHRSMQGSLWTPAVGLTAWRGTVSLEQANNLPRTTWIDVRSVGGVICAAPCRKVDVIWRRPPCKVRPCGIPALAMKVRW